MQVSCIAQTRGHGGAHRGARRSAVRGPACAAPVASRSAVLGAGDVAGLTVGSAPASAWLRLVGRHAGRRARLHDGAELGRQPEAPDRQPRPRRARRRPRERGQARARRRLKPRANGVDARALGVSAAALRKAQRIAWRDGPVVGQLVVVGAGKDDALVRRLQDVVRTRVRRTLDQSAWDALLARVAARGGRADASTAVQAFSLAVAPLPGVRVPKGPKGSIPEGTLAISWVLANYGRLTPGVRQAFDKAVRARFGLSRDVPAAGGAARRRQGPGRRLRRPAGRRAGHAADRHRPRLSLDGARRRRARRRRGRQLSLRQAPGALHHQRPQRRRLEDRHRPRGLPLPADPAHRPRQRPAVARRRPRVAGRGQRVLRGLPVLAGRRCPLPQGLRGLRRAAADAAGQSHLRRRRLLRAPGRRAAPAPSAACGRRSRRRRWRRQPSRRAARAPRTSSTRGPRASTALPRSARAGTSAGRACRRRPRPPSPRRSSSTAGESVTLTALRLRGASLHAVRQPLGFRRDPGAPRRAASVRIGAAGVDARPTGDAVYCLGNAASGANPAVALTGGDGRQGHDHRRRRVARVRPRRERDVPDPAVPAVQRQPSSTPAAARTAVAAVPHGNPIPAENAKPGTPISVWDIAPRRPAAPTTSKASRTNISYDVGQTAQFKITARHVGYRMDIYRMGWYQGNGARLVASITGLPAATGQTACTTQPTTGLVDCRLERVARRGRSPPTQSRASTSPTSSAATTRREPRLLRRPQRRLALGHLLPDIRHDLAGLQPVRRHEPLQRRPAHGHEPRPRRKVSYNRPFATRGVSPGQDFVFNAEYPMVRWLERNGYDVSYETGVDTDRYGSLIKNHRIFMSTGHDEYWSGQQRANVEAARDAGVNLAVLQRQRGVLEDALGERPPHARLLQDDARPGRAASTPPGVWTGFVARPGRGDRAERRAARERAHRPVLHGQRRAPRAIQVPAQYHNLRSGATRRWRALAARVAALTAGRWATSGTPTRRTVCPPRRAPPSFTQPTG